MLKLQIDYFEISAESFRTEKVPKSSSKPQSSVFSYTIKINPFTGLYRPLGLQEVEDPRISIQSAHEGDQVVSPTHRPPLRTPKMHLVIISVRGRVASDHSAARRIK